MLSELCKLVFSLCFILGGSSTSVSQEFSQRHWFYFICVLQVKLGTITSSAWKLQTSSRWTWYSKVCITWQELVLSIPTCYKCCMLSNAWYIKHIMSSNRNIILANLNVNLYLCQQYALFKALSTGRNFCRNIVLKKVFGCANEWEAKLAFCLWQTRVNPKKNISEKKDEEIGCFASRKRNLLLCLKPPQPGSVFKILETQ